MKRKKFKGLKEWQDVKKGDTIYIFHDIDYYDGMDNGLYYGTALIHDVEEMGIHPYWNYDDETQKATMEKRQTYRIKLINNSFLAVEGETSHCDCMNALFFTTKEEYNEALKDQMEDLMDLIDGLQKEIDSDGTEKV